MFCGCPTVFGAEPNTHGLPGLPGPARLAAGGQPGGDRVHDPDRPGAELLDRVLVPVRPEELLLPGHAEELPDLAVRRAAVHRRLAGRRGRRDRRVRVGIERVHLEEDTGKSLHVGGATGRIHGADYSLVDYNRAGHPAGRGRHQADPGHRRAGARRWPGPTSPSCATCCARWASPTSGWSRARCAATSTSRWRRRAPAQWGTRTETKNVNSLRSVERAVRYEIERQAGVLDAGGRIIQETRHFHEDTGTTTAGPQQGRGPGLPVLPRARPGAGRARRASGSSRSAPALPELPAARRARLQAEWGLSDLDMTALRNAGALDLVEPRPSRPGRAAGRRPQVVAGRAVPAGQRRGRRAGRAADHAGPGRPGRELVGVRRRSTTSWPGRCSTACWPARARPTRSSPPAGWPWSATTARSLAAIDEAIAANPDVAAKIRDGKTAAAGALVGAVMKATRGQADAARARELILERLAAS